MARCSLGYRDSRTLVEKGKTLKDDESRADPLNAFTALQTFKGADFETLQAVLNALKQTLMADVDEATASKLAVNALSSLLAEPTLWQLCTVVQRHAVAELKQTPKAESPALKATVYIHGGLSPFMMEDEVSGYQMTRAQVDAVGSYACLAASLEAFFKMNPAERNMVRLEWVWI